MVRYGVAVFALTLLLAISNAYASGHPVAFYTPSGQVTVNGSVDSGSHGKSIALLLIKEDKDYPNIQSGDIGYISEATVSSTGHYSFDFWFGQKIEDYKILIRLPNGTYQNVDIDYSRPDVMFEGVGLQTLSSVMVEGTSNDILAYAVFDNETYLYGLESCVFTSSNQDVAYISSSKVHAVGEGETQITAVATIDGVTRTSKPLTLAVVKEGNVDAPQMIGASLRKSEVIVDIKGDTSEADNIVFSFDSPMNAQSFGGIRATNIKTGKAVEFSGIYHEQSKCYIANFGDNIGYGFFKFEILGSPVSATGGILQNTSVIEGFDIYIEASDYLVTGSSTTALVKAENYRGINFAADIKEAVFSSTSQILSVSGNVISANDTGTARLEASLIFSGKPITITKEVKCTEIAYIIPQVSALRLNAGSEADINLIIVTTEGDRLDSEGLDISYVSSNPTTLSVSAKGRLTGLATGSAYITVSCGNTSVTFRVGVNLSVPNQSMGYYFSDDFDVLQTGARRGIKIQEYMLNGERNIIQTEAVVFQSSDHLIAEVEQAGIITAKAKGEAVISAIIDEEQMIRKKIYITDINKAFYPQLLVESLNVVKGKFVEAKVLIDEVGLFGASHINIKFCSDNPSVALPVVNGFVAAAEGEAYIYAQVVYNNVRLTTEKVLFKAFTPAGGYMIDDFVDASKLFYMDPRLYINPQGELMTSLADSFNTSAIYKPGGNIKTVTVYKNVMSPTYQHPDIYFYVSADNISYTPLDPNMVSRGDMLNGWQTDIYTLENIPANMQYFKLVLDNRDGNTQRTRIDRVEIGYDSLLSVVGIDIVDDSKTGSLYKKALARRGVITFNQPIRPDSLGNITISDGTNTAFLNGEYDIEGMRYTVELPEKNLKNYTINIEDVQTIYKETMGQSSSLVIQSMDNIYTAGNLRVVDVSGSEIDSLKDDDTINISVELGNSTPTAKEFVLIAAYYEQDNNLVYAEYLQEGITFADTKKMVNVDLDISQKPRFSKMKIFIWENISIQKGLGMAAELENRT